MRSLVFQLIFGSDRLDEFLSATDSNIYGRTDLPPAFVHVQPTAFSMTHARSGLVQRKSWLSSETPRASETDGLRSYLVIDFTALTDNPHPAPIPLFKDIEPRVSAAEFLLVYAAQFVIGSLHDGSGAKDPYKKR